MTPTMRARNLIDLMADLSKIIEQENDQLSQPSVDLLSPILTEKQVLFDAYEVQLRELTSQPDFVKKIDPEIRTRLALASRNFDDLARSNARKLKVMMDSSKQVINNIAKSARKASGTLNAYNASGIAKETGPRSAPIALNQSY